MLFSLVFRPSPSFPSLALRTVKLGGARERGWRMFDPPPLQSSTQAPAGGTPPTAVPSPLQWSLGSLLLYQWSARKVQTATD